ncbi:MAG: DegT/DnrJ/EryC1/StrS family aminotransferase [Candidatus Omnitrophica bacterium]|nr:DegT/DnrJ/EryC1/StrS family aminotransferase [Candidatus Omnitrophota bacterium]MDD5236791.1 DegT/DnrJ/EryC1/StrS family aminotransferase [Candidatus Omnitrophota bacterium]MDD5609970.1 DegT/DnrJ/EryC1/StrS family aminotransferase [Candidatus Omnitrophota bacterium]
MNMRIIPRKTVNVSLEEFRAAVNALAKNQCVTGPQIELFEKQFAGYINAKYAIAVSSARLGIWAIFKALGYSAGDEVIVSSFNFSVIPDLLRSMGLNPVFVDIDPDTYNINVAGIEKKISPKTKYILITHMYGQPCDLAPILDIAKKYNLKVIEDCAHACGSEYKSKKVGSFGDAACFSFGIGKAMVTFGGGMVTVNSQELYNSIKDIVAGSRMLSGSEAVKKIFLGFILAYSTKKFATYLLYPLNLITDMLGHDLEELLDKAFLHEEDFSNYKVKFTNIQASIGIEQLKKIERLNSIRITNSENLTKGLSVFGGIKVFKVLDEVKHTYLYYPLRVPAPKKLKRFLLRKGIDIKISSQKNCSCLDPGREPKDEYVYADSVSNKVIELPNSYNLNKKDIDYIIRAIGDFSVKEN